MAIEVSPLSIPKTESTATKKNTPSDSRIGEILKPRTAEAAAATKKQRRDVGDAGGDTNHVLIARLPLNNLGRVIAKIRSYDADAGEYGLYKDITLVDTVPVANGDCWIYKLKRGGILKFHPHFVEQGDCQDLVEVLENSKIFRQYKIQNGDEPRLHGLVSCDDPAQVDSRDTAEGEGAQGPKGSNPSPGYGYHGVRMKANAHVSEFPLLEAMSKRAAVASGLKTPWKIGCDIVLYRSGNDKIGYHADDTQGEEVIFCVVLESSKVRGLHIKPKLRKRETLADGDEEVKILAAVGDAYEMNGEMQNQYVHSLPRAKDEDKRFDSILDQGKFKRRRMALVFRDGIKRSDVDDNGTCAHNLLRGKSTPRPEVQYPFGSMSPLLQETVVYSRTFLLDTCAHGSVQGGVSGTIERGCSSIVVSRENSRYSELESFESLLYSSTGHQGGGSLFRSMSLKNPIRVFRTSGLNNSYRACEPPNPAEEGRKIRGRAPKAYRYDGLYKVMDCREREHNETPKFRPKGKTMFTFWLLRFPAKVNLNVYSPKRFRSMAISSGTMPPTPNELPLAVATNRKALHKARPEAKTRCYGYESAPASIIHGSHKCNRMTSGIRSSVEFDNPSAVAIVSPFKQLERWARPATEASPGDELVVASGVRHSPVIYNVEEALTVDAFQRAARPMIATVSSICLEMALNQRKRKSDSVVSPATGVLVEPPKSKKRPFRIVPGASLKKGSRSDPLN